MRIRFGLSLVSILFLTVGCMGIDANRVQGSGTPASETRQVEAFTRLNVEGSANVFVTVGPQQSVTIETDDNILPLIETRVKGQSLVVSSRQSYSSRLGVKVTVTVPQFDGISISGSGNATISGVDSEEFAVAVSGSGDVVADGKAQHVKVSIAGSGGVKVGDLAAKTAKISISGSGNATVNASEVLDISIAGSGDVRYKGSPKVSQSVAGSGRVRQAG